MKKGIIFLVIALVILSFFLLSGCDVLNLLFESDNTETYEENPNPSEQTVESEAQITTTNEATAVIPFVAHMYSIKDFDVPDSFLTTVEKASKAALSDKIRGIKDNDYVNLLPMPNSPDEIFFKLNDIDIYYYGQVFIIPSYWRDWIKETYPRVVGSIQFLGENNKFTSASLSLSGGHSFVPLCYILKIHNQNGDYYKLLVTPNYKGSTSQEDIYKLYSQIFNDFNSSEKLGFIVIYAVFSGDKYIDDFALGILYTGLSQTVPNQDTFFIPITGLK
ncbi:hypothetical protein HNP65_000337 [Thermosipho japonicus]|uniref:Lipoprotein n=1 Tax=Thermosipho japonicus TaxID=90323 RepID=A0A841GIT1_9BACT|nr:hypothetical protein [Thermosipho japonicus]MBB6061915.1 hypothetical protein [Thermosipho japonicus]